MDMIDVQSSNIRAIGWEADADEDSDVEGALKETGTLRITFANGRTYDYDDVPESEYDALRNASSIGSHFHQAIRNVYVGVQQ